MSRTGVVLDGDNVQVAAWAKPKCWRVSGLRGPGSSEDDMCESCYRFVCYSDQFYRKEQDTV
jgi:hypothetical protein